jgi:anaerobic selenocysteine-containing dehydrogenase
MIRQCGEKGFRRVSWDEALEVIGDRICATTPDRLSFYITSQAPSTKHITPLKKLSGRWEATTLTTPPVSVILPVRLVLKVQ